MIKTISPQPPNYTLKSLWIYRELFYFLIWRDIKVRYKQTVMGVLWVILQPFITMIVFTFVFGTIAKISTGDIPYPIFVYTGLIFWNLFAKSLIASSQSIIANRSLVKSISFPKIILPLASVIAQLVDFLAAFLVLLILMGFFSIIPNSTGFIVVPVAIFIILLFSSGLGSILSSLNVVYRDIGFLIPYALQIFLFLTPVVYPTDLVGERYRLIITINPLASLIETVRSSFLSTGDIPLYPFLSSIVLGLMVFFVGIIYFRKKEGMVADIL